MQQVPGVFTVLLPDASPKLHGFADSLAHAFDAFDDTFIRHVGEVDTHAAVGFVIGIECVTDNASNLFLNALLEYLQSAYADREG